MRVRGRGWWAELMLGLGHSDFFGNKMA